MPAPLTPDHLLDALRCVIDPEAGMNIVDLGLIYRTECDDRAIRIDMTMTSPACPMGDMILDDVRAALGKIAAGRAIDVCLVWEPAWEPSMMSTRAKGHFGWQAETSAPLPPAFGTAAAAAASFSPPRIPLLIFGMLSLVTGVLAGLSRFAVEVPAFAAGQVGLHGAFMISAFLGTVISLERAVAFGAAWAYFGPLAAGVGGLVLLGGGMPLAAQGLFITAATVLSAVSFILVQRQPSAHGVTLALGATAWLFGNLAWAAGGELMLALPGWIAFLVLTIAGERLELSRYLPTDAAATRIFMALIACLLATLPAHLIDETAIPRLFGLTLVALALWLLRYDIARRTVRDTGLTRYIAVCLLTGYAWLIVGGLLGAIGGFAFGHPLRDAALHTIFLGFVFSMIFGHAPIIFPAVARVKIPYHPAFYAPLALLHLSLLARVAGDLDQNPALARAAALANAIALLVFVLTVLARLLSARFPQTS